MRSRTLTRLLMALGLVAGVAVTSDPGPVAAQSYQRISGEGSSWAYPFIDAMRVNVQQFGMTIDYNPSGSTQGRTSFRRGLVDFAASDIPFQLHPEDGSEPERMDSGTYAYMPIVAGGTAFMYNLKINGQAVTNLRLSGANVAKIFTGAITMWNDPAIQADNPGLVMPARQIVPVTRSDGSGSSAQFTMWMTNRHPQIWQSYCDRVGRSNSCGFTSNYPAVPGMQQKVGDDGIAGYVSQSTSEGAIGYVNYSYALNVGFPVAKVLNAAGYYTEPNPYNVAVSLVQADVETENTDPAVYLTQKLEGVYNNTDPRNYELSSYSYFILPTTTTERFNEDKGYTLAEFSKYMMCQGQENSESLGYSPMPLNLVQRSFEQIRKIPGADVGSIDIAADCNNPTFTPDGHNALVDQAPMPQTCDRQDYASQCPDGTAGMRNVPTVVRAPGSNSGQPSNPGDPNQPSNPGDPTDPGNSNTSNQSDNPGDAGNSNTSNQSGNPGDPTDPGNSNTSNQSSNSSSNGQTSGATTSTAPCAPVATTTTTTVPGAPPPSVPPGATTTTTSTTTTTTSVPGAASASTTTTTTIVPCNSTTTTLAARASGGGGTTTTPFAQAGCDADTGVCSGGATAGDGQVVAPPQGAVMPTTLAQRSRWGSSQTLVVLVSLLTLGAVFGPAWAWRHFAQKVVPR